MSYRGNIGSGQGKRNASQAANDWAQKKKEQMERAKILREQRKQGAASSHLQSAGEIQMNTSSSNMRQVSANRQPSGYNSNQQPVAQQQHEPTPQEIEQMRYEAYQKKVQQENEAFQNALRSSPTKKYNKPEWNSNSEINYDTFGQRLDNFEPVSKPSYAKVGEHRQSNDQYQRNQPFGNSPMVSDNRNNKTPGLPPRASQGGDNNWQSHQISNKSGFKYNPISRKNKNFDGNNFSHQADSDQSGYMGSTAYSNQNVLDGRQDPTQPRGYIDLAGNKKSSNSYSQSAIRDRPDASGFSSAKQRIQNQIQQHNQNIQDKYEPGFGRDSPDKYSRRSNQMQQRGPKPPLLPPSASQPNNMGPSISVSDAPTPQGKKQNYRRTFKPNIPTSQNSNRGGMENESPSVHQRQRLKPKQETSYEPQKRDQQMRREVINSSKQKKKMPQPKRGGFDPYDDMDQDPFGQRAQPRVGNSPQMGIRPNPLPKAQPKKSNFGGGIDIYAQAAMNQNINPFGDAVPQDDGDRRPCPTCGRKFNEIALAKHVKICKKVFFQKRKEFDVKAARAPEEMKQLQHEQKMNARFNKHQKPAPRKDERPTGGKGGGMPKWKAQSLMFRQAMQANRGGGGGASMGGAGVAQAQAMAAEQMDDRITCPWCNRKFNETAGNRHMPHCEKKYKEQQMRMGGKPKPSRGGRTRGGF